MVGSPSHGLPSWVPSILNPSKWRQRLDLDSMTFLMMLKGALPPTIVIAISQSDAIADITTTIGYLAALMSVVSQALLPRAKFMKIMLFILLSTCVAASICCLAIFCAVEARKHNTPPDASESVRNGYSSDACAVSAIWLVFVIWAANTLRAWKPVELQDPMVAFSIFSSVTITRAGTFVTLSEGLSFVSRLLKGFMIGFAIATGVSLFIFPITSRGNVFHDIKGYISQIEMILKAQIEYTQGSSAAWARGHGLLSRTRTAMSVREAPGNSESDLETKRKRLSAAITRLNALHSKLQSDLFYSKDEIAWGKLSAQDLHTISGFLRSLLLPLSGMAMLPEILEMMVKNEGKRDTDEDELDESSRSDIEKDEVVKALHDRLVESTSLISVGLQYALLHMELIKEKHLVKLRKSSTDEEQGVASLDPLQEDFIALFEQQISQFRARRKHLPRALASLQAFSVSEKTTTNVGSDDDMRIVAQDPDVRQEFFLILYMGQMQENMLKATLDLMKFVDGKIADGTMKRNRLIFPINRSIASWLSLTSERDSGNEDDRRMSSQVNSPSIYPDDNEPVRKPDPEHLPPANAWERGSVVLRAISRFIKCEQSVFGFRVAAASLSVGILAFLHQTQDFFLRQRCIWAMIVIVIGMSPNSGQTMLGFATRIIATSVSLALGLIVWYIVDQKTPGVIVFLYLANVFEYYFYVKVPQYFGPSVIAIVTLNVIVGYELQMRKLGLEVGTSNGQPYYPIYLFGPYKLLAVAAGCAISFFWVIFPYPITAKSILRKNLGRGLFVLAKFYSCMHTTIELWLAGELGNVQDARSASYKLEKIRHKVFRDEMVLLNSIRSFSHFSTFEPPIGGKFPKAVYDSIISEMHRMLISMALMAHTTQNLDSLSPTGTHASGDGEGGDGGGRDKWASRLASIALQSADFKSHNITSLLCHVSSSITNAQPLPPYLSAGHSFPLARQLQQIDGDLLSIQHVEDPAFSAFVSLEVLRSVVSFSLKDLLSDVKCLVGELSFDFHIHRAQEEDESARLLPAVSPEV